MASEYELPNASVARIMKAALPSNIQVAKEVKSSFCKAAGLFILYLTTTANDTCKLNKRTTVTAADVMEALNELEFDEFIPPLQSFLERYREEQSNKKSAKKASKASAQEQKEIKAAAAAAAAIASADGLGAVSGKAEASDNDAVGSKRPREDDEEQEQAAKASKTD